MGAPSTRPKIVEYFAKRPGEHCFLGDITKDTKLLTQQVQSAINNIRAAHARGEIDFPIEVHQKGQIWIYRPNSDKDEVATGKMMFEEVRPTKRNTIVIQSTDGKLYEATEL